MIPIARTEKLLIQEVGNELIVYDQETNGSHCLNPMAARVWELCDGQNTVNNIAQKLEKELNINEDMDIRGLVWLTLEELERYGLIENYLKQPTSTLTVSRRKIIKTTTLVSGLALGSMFPLVRSIVAPTPAMADSGARNCKGGGNCEGQTYNVCGESSGPALSTGAILRKAREQAQKQCNSVCSPNKGTFEQQCEDPRTGTGGAPTIITVYGTCTCR